MPMPTRRATPLHENAQDVAYRHLLDWILNGPLETDEIIRDTEVAELLGVSRTPVREALIRLSQEGLVVIERGKGTRVAPIAYERAPWLFQVGCELDGLAAELAFSKMEPDDLARMREILTEMENERDSNRLRGLDEAFHDVYYHRSGNEVLVETMTDVNRQLRRLERVSFRDVYIREAAHEEHVRILAAFEGNDAAAARAAARANWSRSWDRIEHRRPHHEALAAGSEPVGARISPSTLK